MGAGHERGQRRGAERVGCSRGDVSCGQHPNVAALDVVEIDPTKDVHDLTARSGCSIILTFLAGLYRRTYGDRGY